ncbi:division plane positioning ATPase MipZ [Roseospira visakhapatnamensis]|uniref:Chromosome partitioning protein n=1 Tax=Roseospira visakhapatnamensis TaxID=390880 RepID=A0A7W6RDA9_9PROT|nr:division plane positioning ATPase MipZ [Roseospira visakhapatnamensis]MBB4266347.1 chromosome partitioning protein [Roseospira visakhapatnamensis]
MAAMVDAARHGPRPARVVVVGNEKGGSGKSTVAMHLLIGFLRAGFSVGSIDLDARQGTLSTYVSNREAYVRRTNVPLPLPTHQAIQLSGSEQGDINRLDDAVGALLSECDLILIDTPGADNYLSRAGHAWADILVTPLNDSFIDLDVLAKVDPDTMRIQRPSHYSEMVWDIKKRRGLRDGGTIHWVVLRNRLSQLDARNKRDMEQLLRDLSRRIGFQLIEGLCERVIYREMYLKGLTLLDLREKGTDITLSMSHIAARQELRRLLEALGVPAHAGEPVMAASA